MGITFSTPEIRVPGENDMDTSTTENNPHSTAAESHASTGVHRSNTSRRADRNIQHAFSPYASQQSRINDPAVGDNARGNPLSNERTATSSSRRSARVSANKPAESSGVKCNDDNMDNVGGILLVYK